MKPRYRPMATDATLVYPPGGHGDPKQVTNLGWLLKHWREVDRIDIRAIHAVDDVTNPKYWDCVITAWLKDGRAFVTPFASSDICRDWLDRPVFRGRPLRWFGYEGVCGGEKHRSHYMDYRW